MVTLMRLRLVPMKGVWPLPAWGTALVMVWLSLAGAVTWLSARRGVEVSLCPLRGVTGLPCPFCGTGRAGLCVLEGRLLDAWRFNPLVCACALVATMLLLLRVALRRRLRIERTPREERALWLAALLLLFLNWCYVIACVG